MKKFLFISLLFFSISILVKGIEIFEYFPFLFSDSKKEILSQQFLNSLGKKIVFTGKMENTEKVVTIYKEGDNLVYAYGLELQKPEIKIVGKAGKNLFKNFGGMDLEPWYHLVFKNKNYSYVITYTDNNDFGPRYRLEVYKDGNLNPIFHKRLDSSTVTDVFFLDYINDEESIFYNLPQDKVPFYY